MINLAGRSVLVTGGTGFIGSHLVTRLIQDGVAVRVLVRDTNNLGRLEHYRDSLALIQGDLRTPESLTPILDRQPAIVFHLAAFGVERPFGNIAEALAANVQGTANLLALFAENTPDQLPRLIYTGTDFEYGSGSGLRHESDAPNPPNTYAATKTAGWAMCQAFSASHGFPVVGVRPFLTYGPDQGDRRLIPYTILTALTNREMHFSPGDQIRDFIFVTDVVNGLVQAATHPDAANQMFNLGTGTGHSLRNIVERIVALTGSGTRPQFGAMPYRHGEIMDLRADITKAREVLAWAPIVDLEQGLTKTIDWYRKQSVL